MMLLKSADMISKNTFSAELFFLSFKKENILTKKKSDWKIFFEGSKSVIF